MEFFYIRALRRFFLLSLLTLSLGVQTKSVLATEKPTILRLTQTAQPQATAKARAGYRQEELRQIRPEYYDLGHYPVTNSNEDYWRNRLWTTAIVEPQEAYVANALNKIVALTQQSGLSESQMRTIEMAMQVGTQLYLSNPAIYASLKQQFLQTIECSNDSEWVAIALSGLAKGDTSPQQLRQLVDRTRARFPGWSPDLVLRTTLQDVAESLSPTPMPPLKDLLNWTIRPGQLHIYVICALPHQVLCRAVLKGRDGKFVQTPVAGKPAQLWSVPLLLSSIHGLSWNLFRGQSPQGIYRIEGTTSPDPETFRAYGQFPLVNLFLPFETGVDKFLPGQKGPFTGSIRDYQALLPPSWRGYSPMEQSYWAGLIGRSLFRIHGSGESPDYFSRQNSKDSHNWNPTLGCLSALERYDEAGVLQQADMPKILNALTAAGGKNFTGYLIMVEMPHLSEPISLKEIEAAVQPRYLTLIH